MNPRNYKHQFKLNDLNSKKTAQQKLLSLFLMLLLILFAEISQGQKAPYAKLTQSGVIILPTDRPLSETYILDMASLQFNSDDDLIKFLSTRSQDLYLMRSRSSKNEGVLVLQTSSKPEWGIQQWNEFFVREGKNKPLSK